MILKISTSAVIWWTSAAQLPYRRLRISPSPWQHPDIGLPRARDNMLSNHSHGEFTVLETTQSKQPINLKQAAPPSCFQRLPISSTQPAYLGG